MSETAPLNGEHEESEEEDEEEEDEFKERLPTGLKAVKTTEEETRCMYFKMIGGFNFVLAPVLSWGAYFATKYLIPGQQSIYEKKFAFVYDYQLGYVYLAWVMVYLTRMYLTINANGARAAAGCDRPDQHIYKIMAAEGTLADSPYVLMATAGDAGRFNRAQRAVYNTDEGLPLFITGAIITGSILPHVVLAIACIYAYGRITFANTYKASLNARGMGFMLGATAETFVCGLAQLCAIKGLCGPLITV